MTWVNQFLFVLGVHNVVVWSLIAENSYKNKIREEREDAVEKFKSTIKKPEGPCPKCLNWVKLT